MLSFHGERYPLSIGRLSYGLLFGVSKAQFARRVSNIRSPRDVVGVYGALSVAAAVGIIGANAIVLSNEKGALFELTDSQVGLIVDLDLLCLVIWFK